MKLRQPPYGKGANSSEEIFSADEQLLFSNTRRHLLMTSFLLEKNKKITGFILTVSREN